MKKAKITQVPNNTMQKLPDYQFCYYHYLLIVFKIHICNTFMLVLTFTKMKNSVLHYLIATF